MKIMNEDSNLNTRMRSVQGTNLILVWGFGLYWAELRWAKIIGLEFYQ